VAILGERAGYALGVGSLLILAGVFVAMLAGEKIASLLPLAPLKALGAVLQDSRYIVLSGRTGVPAVALSLVIQFGVSAVACMIAISAGIELDFVESLLLFPLINMASTLPISIAGWGVREAASVYIFRRVGISPNDALVISLLYGFTTMLLALPGGAIWLVQRRSPSEGAGEDRGRLKQEPAQREEPAARDGERAAATQGWTK
jgi:glycosyltransferase 2 family protein